MSLVMEPASFPLWMAILDRVHAPMSRKSRKYEMPGRVFKHSPHTNGRLRQPSKHEAPFSVRARGGPQNLRMPFLPPEDWHEPCEDGRPYKIIVQDPGKGYQHVLTPEEVRERLAQLPERFLENLEVVQFSRMTRKKQSFPCYGMQWGTTLYLYPIESGLTEYCSRPPRPEQAIEAEMYGVRWVEDRPGLWKLQWNEAAIKDFYLNNILIHELGHLLDERNSGYVDRERYAEAFANKYGAPNRRSRPKRKKVIRRHHAV